MNLGEFALLQCKQIAEGPFISTNLGQLWGSEPLIFFFFGLGFLGGIRQKWDFMLVLRC